MKNKKRYIVVFLILIVYFIWKNISSPIGSQVVIYAPAHKECYDENKFKYCVYKSDLKNNGNVAYYLHGRNLDASAWNDDTFYTSMVQKYWQDKKITPPIVVAVSYGPVWLLSPKNAREGSGLLEHFIVA